MTVIFLPYNYCNMIKETLNIEDINFFNIEEMIIFNDKLWEEKWITLKDQAKKDFDIKKNKTTKVSKIIKDLFLKKENCIFLTWAWTSYSSGWPLMWDLWWYFIWDEKLIKNKVFLKNIWELLKEYISKNSHDIFKEYLKKLNHDLVNNNLEEFLSSLLVYIRNLENLTKKGDKDLKEAIEFKDKIELDLKKLCNIQLSTNSEHFYLLYFINKIRGWSNKSRLKIFTLNYDTLFEQTANEYWYTIIDGFSFSTPRKFNSSNFDLDIIEKEDNRVENNKLHENVFHLYKLHGSLNWVKDWDKYYHMEIDKDNIIGEIIYPWKAKYEKSYDMPYFEMLTRFQFELRKKDVVINIIWYWFWDDHINRMILEALKNNNWLTLNIFASNFYEIKWSIIEINIYNDFIKWIIPYIKMQRINILNLKFWWLVNLLKVDKPDTLEEKLEWLLNPDLLHKFNNDDS